MRPGRVRWQIARKASTVPTMEHVAVAAGLMDLFRRHGAVMLIVEPVSGDIVDANDAATQFYGYTSEQLRVKRIEDLNVLRPEEVADLRRRALQRDLNGFTCPHRMADGSIRQVQVHSSPFADGDHTLLFSIIHDITEIFLAREAAAHQATHDPLSGLPNRVLFSERLDEAFARADPDRAPVVLLFCDLDGFKQANDTYGHHVGDFAIRKVAERLSSCVASCDTVARYGGDEFMVLSELLRTDDEVRSLAERILATVALPIDVGGVSLGLTTSIGVASAVAADSDSLLRLADEALYEAKAKGRNTWALHPSCRMGPEGP